MAETDKQNIHALSNIECEFVRLISSNTKIFSITDIESIRWSLSLARITKIRLSNNDTLNIAHALDIYRTRLYEIFKNANSIDAINIDNLKKSVYLINQLVRNSQTDLLSFFSGKLQRKDLDKAISKRPLALALGGGGGTCYVFVGAFKAFAESNIVPSAMAGSSMGAILGAYRALHKNFSLSGLEYLVKNVSWNMLAKPYAGPSYFGVPATFRLYLRESLGELFKKNTDYPKIKDLLIPLKICVAGLSNVSAAQEDLSVYSRLLASSNDPYNLNIRSGSILNQILSFAQKPLKPIYLGNSQLSKNFDLLDALGFSSAIPAVFHYDIFREDKEMIEIIKKLFEQENVFRLIDGGFADNLPSQQALLAIQNGESLDGYDPFVLALDSFVPSLNKNLLFYPLMRFTYENSKEGHKKAHLVIKFKKVLSPINFVPSETMFYKAIEWGYEEIKPHMQFIENMLAVLSKPKIIQ